MKTGVGIGAGMVNVLENAVKTSKSPALNQEGLISKGAKAVNKAARNKYGKEALDKANTAIGQAKAGGLARRGPR